MSGAPQTTGAKERARGQKGTSHDKLWIQARWLLGLSAHGRPVRCVRLPDHQKAPAFEPVLGSPTWRTPPCALVPMALGFAGCAHLGNRGDNP